MRRNLLGEKEISFKFAQLSLSSQGSQGFMGFGFYSPLNYILKNIMNDPNLVETKHWSVTYPQDKTNRTENDKGSRKSLNFK